VEPIRLLLHRSRSNNLLTKPLTISPEISDCERRSGRPWSARMRPPRLAGKWLLTAHRQVTGIISAKSSLPQAPLKTSSPRESGCSR
jgi:hypothetical protein